MHFPNISPKNMAQATDPLGLTSNPRPKVYAQAHTRAVRVVVDRGETMRNMGTSFQPVYLSCLCNALKMHLQSRLHQQNKTSKL